MKQVVVNQQLWSFEYIEGIMPPILVLHGWGRSKEEWGRLGRDLNRATQRAIYCLDLPGFGGSSMPAVTNISQYTALLVEWLKYMKIKKAGIVGHSLGGRMALWLASHYPEMVEAMGLIAPAGVKPKSWKRQALMIGSKVFSWVPVGIRRKLSELVMDEDYRNSPPLRELYRAVVGEDLKAVLSKISCPTRVIWGERDPILPLELTKVYGQLLSSPAIKVIWEAGHDPHLTHYDLLKRAVEEVWV